ncbi:hypothetical protein FJT64_003317 [Amphibalanus amphitrite]|uniref:Uncharacterized protein n=1 Tax=Amphibalanus amphitrite TaxID=1232801 RepID=A0A6A4W4E6_AMPAM|nr:hypothetical protein FJT64_003317 [Amphibalanus amphitrite]
MSDLSEEAMGLKQSKRSFQVTTDTPKKDGAPEAAIEAIEVKEATKEPVEATNGDAAAAQITKTEQPEVAQNGGGDAHGVNGGGENGKEATNGDQAEEKKEEAKEEVKEEAKEGVKEEKKVKKKISFRSFSFLRKEKKQKEVKKKNAKNDDKRMRFLATFQCSLFHDAVPLHTGAVPLSVAPRCLTQSTDAMSDPAETKVAADAVPEEKPAEAAEETPAATEEPKAEEPAAPAEEKKEGGDAAPAPAEEVN